MTETKRVPTEAEALVLLREVAQKKEDAEAIDEAARLSAGRMKIAAGAPMVLVLLVVGALWLAHNEVPFTVAMLLLLLAVLCVQQSAQIADLRRATRALARSARRAREAEPLPHAPSPSP